MQGRRPGHAEVRPQLGCQQGGVLSWCWAGSCLVWGVAHVRAQLLLCSAQRGRERRALYGGAFASTTCVRALPTGCTFVDALLLQLLARLYALSSDKVCNGRNVHARSVIPFRDRNWSQRGVCAQALCCARSRTLSPTSTVKQPSLHTAINHSGALLREAPQPRFSTQRCANGHAPAPAPGRRSTW